MRDSFVAKMYEAIEQGLKAGQVTRLQAFRLKAALLFPRQRELIRKQVEIELALEDYASEAGLIDWDNIDVDKLIAILEAIMMFIDFLSKFQG